MKIHEGLLPCLSERLATCAADIIGGETVFSDRVHGLLVEASDVLARTPSPSGAREIETEERLVQWLYDNDPMCGHADCEYTASKLWPIIESALRSQGRGEGE